MTGADWLRALTTVVSAGLGAWIASVIAIQKWRTEMTGKRRAELAEDVLADFYRLRAEFKFKPIVYALMKIDRPARELAWREDDAFFASLLAKRYRFEAVFGTAAAAPFADLARIKSGFFAEVLGPMEGMEEKAPTRESTAVLIEQAVAKIEATCRDAITARKPFSFSAWRASS